MRNRKSLLSVLLVIALFIQPVTSIAQTQATEQVIIGFYENIDTTLIESYGGTIKSEFKSINAAAATVPTRSIHILQNNSAVAFLDIDQEITVASQQIDWGVQRINAPRAWSHQFTGKGIKVAVIDTGVDSHHPDLNIIKGKSFIPGETNFDDHNGHGTHIAGIIAAKNNQIGTVGVAPDVELYIAKVLDKDGNGYQSAVIDAIEWSIAQGVDIINLSAGSEESTTSLERAVNNARNKGVIIVGAAGNRGNRMGSGSNVDFPAAYPAVIAVAAVDHSDRRAPFSATGNQIEVSAPGVNIFSTHLNGSYAHVSGTSMAAPHVTGMLAILMEMLPDATPDELRALVQQKTVDLGPVGKDSHFGYGRIQFSEAFIRDHITPASPINFQAELDEATVTLTWDHPTSESPITNYRIYQNNNLLAEVDSTTNTHIHEITPGTYEYHLVSVNSGKKESEKTEKRTIILQPPPEVKIFKDIPDEEWFAAPIYFLAEREIILGYEDETIRPNERIKRADAALMLTRALGIEPSQNPIQFPDVKQTHYAAGEIQAAVELKLISGYPDGTFAPDDHITRGEVAALIERAYKPVPIEEITFPDVTEDYFAFAAINIVAGAGIATGYPNGTFRPRNHVTRAEFATLLYRTIQQLP